MWSDEGVRPRVQMHPDALIVRTQLYHRTGKIVTLIGKVFLKFILREVRSCT